MVGSGPASSSSLDGGAPAGRPLARTAASSQRGATSAMRGMQARSRPARAEGDSRAKGRARSFRTAIASSISLRGLSLRLCALALISMEADVMWRRYHRCRGRRGR